jgi:small subunit ribosomal protein S10e
MMMTKAHRMAILTYLFKEGVIVAKKDFNLAKHPDVEEASNLEVIKLMTSLTSKDLVSCRFSWKHYYWFLNDDGIEWLREYLHLPADMVPNTLKKAAATRPPAPPGRGDREGGDRPRGPPRGFGGDREGYRSDGPPRGFGRGAPRPAA